MREEEGKRKKEKNVKQMRRQLCWLHQSQATIRGRLRSLAQALVVVLSLNLGQDRVHTQRVVAEVAQVLGQAAVQNQDRVLEVAVGADLARDLPRRKKNQSLLSRQPRENLV